MLFQNPSNAEILGFIPIIVFSGVVGAAIALLGTHLQNKAFAKRQKEALEEQANQQKERLKYEAEQKKLEREMIMRRDIFLSGIEAVGKMHQFLLAFSNVNQPAEARENILVGTSSALNKIGVIAKYETLEALNKVNTCYTRNFPILIEKRMYWDHSFQHKTNIENHIQTLFQRNQQLVSILNAQSNNLTAEQIQLINTELQNNHNEIQENENLVTGLNHKIADQMIELLNLCFQSVTELQKLSADCVLMIRRELEFPIDEIKFRNLIVESAERDAIYVTDWYKTLVEKNRHEL